MVSLNIKIEVIDEKVAQILRTKTPQERIQMTHDAWASFCIAIKSYLKFKNPDWSQSQIQKEVLRRLNASK